MREFDELNELRSDYEFEKAIKIPSCPDCRRCCALLSIWAQRRPMDAGSPYAIRKARALLGDHSEPMMRNFLISVAINVLLGVGGFVFCHWFL